MKDRFRVIPSVYLLLVKDGKILLLRRRNTGYFDGYYGMPAGHMEANETLADGTVREAMEEAGVAVRKENLRLAHVLYRKSGIPAPHERADFFFTIDIWEGEPRNMEPEKCDDMGWFPLAALPENTVPEQRQGIVNAHLGKFYSEIWPSENAA